MIQDRINLKEKIVHGSADFPLCVYRSHQNQDENILFCHWHDEMEIMYLASGRAVFSLDTVPVEISEGEAVIINQGTVHSGFSDDFSNCVFYAIVFDFTLLYHNKIGDSLSKYLIPINQKQVSLPVRIGRDSECNREILRQIRNIIDAYMGKIPAYQLSILSSLYAILGEFILQNRIVSSAPEIMNSALARLEQFKTVLSYIETNYNGKLSIKDMADQINMSQYHFCRFFKSFTGKTPMEYLIGYRIYQAELLLKDPARKIIEIAMDVGFNNFSYFIKCFKGNKKMTPAKYRRQYTSPVLPDIK